MGERRGATTKLCNKMLCYRCAVNDIRIYVYRYANESSQKRSQQEADRSFFVVASMTGLRHAAPNAASMFVRDASLSARGGRIARASTKAQ